MIISGIVKTSLVDYPGKVACVLFTPHCNYDCFFCHNRELLEGASTVIPFCSIMDFLIKRRGLLEGVVISGGEPTLQPELKETITEIKKLGYRVKLDTNGSFPEKVEKLLGLCDYFSVDYKAPRRRYREICGKAANPEKVLETIRRLLGSGVPFEVRTTVLPQLGLEDLFQMAEELPLLPRFVLNRYRRPEIYKKTDTALVEAPPHPQAELRGFVSRLRLVQPNIPVGISQ